MKKLFFSCSSLLATMLLLSTTVLAQTADDIVTAYLKKAGGKDAWQKIEAMQMKGSSATQMGSFPTTLTQMKPNLMKVEVNIQGMSYVEGYDGEVAWVNNPFMGGLGKKTEAETKAAANETLEPELVDYKSKGHSLELVGTKEVQGKDTYEVKFVTKDGEEKLYYFDKESGLPILIKQKAVGGEMAGRMVEVYMNEYKEVGGIQFPHKIENKVGGNSVLSMIIEEVKVNPEGVGAKTFAYPGGK